MAALRSIKIKVSPEIGSVSGIRITPDSAKAVVVLAHGAGAGMNHVFMTGLAKNLAEKDIATIRFNFPFSEQNKKRPDSLAVAQATIAAALKKAISLYPDIPVFLSGKSFGGRMSSHLLSLQPELPVKGIIFYGFPLHQPGKPGVERAEHLKNIRHPMLFLQGTRDALADFALVKKVTGKLKSVTLIKLEGADHGFKSGKKDLLPELAANTDEWIQKLI